MNRKTILPNIVTGLNFLFGIFSLMFILNEEYSYAVICVFVAMLCDFLDGQIARKNNATSDFGVQFDSMSDLVSFGIVPGILAFSFVLREMAELGVFISCVYMLSCGIRLAVFNVKTQTSSKKEFIGLPSPNAAGLVCSCIILIIKYDNPFLLRIFPIVVLGSAVLMLSKVKYPVPMNFIYFLRSKFTKWTRWGLVSAFVVLLYTNTEIVMSLGFVSYTIFGLTRSVFIKLSSRSPIKAFNSNKRKY